MTDNTVTLTFTPEQLDSLKRNHFRPEQTHRQHDPDELDSVYVYENDDDEMVLWVFHKNGDVHRESRLFHFSSGWGSDEDEDEDE